ncbi:MAG: hypothetical protein PVG51_18140, partial [Desulfosarcina sp.]
CQFFVPTFQTTDFRVHSQLTGQQLCSGYPREKGLLKTTDSLPGDLTIRECIEFSFYNWISRVNFGSMLMGLRF